MGFVEEFKKFISRGSLLDLAVGIMVGGAFNSIIQSFVKDILTPVVAIFTGKAKLGEWTAVFDLPSVTGQGEATQIVLSYGRFLQTVLDFLILSLVVFTIIKAFNRLKDKAEDPKNAQAPTPKDIQLLSEIRDLLARPKE
ncbi:MAG: large conductance mechanosensitive channel protein MscL [Bacteriovoracaceae bacterium]|nr:large conductance mechanosensitive channel protein MscL [Bacteriovoracaceae bacterium]